MGRSEDDGSAGATGDLKTDLKRCQKAPMSFAFGLKDGQASVLLLHKNKSSRALGNEVKTKLGAKQATFGMARAEGKVLLLDVEGPKLSGLHKRVRSFLKKEGVTLYSQVRVFVGGVEVAEEEGASGAGAPLPGGAAPGAAADAIATAKAAYATAPGGPPQHTVSAEENDALSGLAEDELRARDLTQRNPKELFTPDYMDGLVGLKVQGANDPQLKDVMRQLQKGASGAKREQLIAQLAKLRGGDPAKLDTEYGRFLVLRDQQAAVQKKKQGEGKDVDAVPDLAEDIHDEFSASNPQLVFGKVVGDAFGIDPVFGALLSPTGGMVGPGNTALHLDDDDPTGYHGIVHDAAGYLYNYHDQGPGYDYLGSEGRDTADPLTGQQSGMRYWHEKLDPGMSTTVMNGVIDVVCVHKDALDEAKKTYGAARKVVGETVEQIKVDAEKALESARDTVNEAIDSALSGAAQAVESAGTALEEVAQEVSATAEAAVEAVEETVVQTYDDATEAVGNMADAASEKMNAAWDYVWN